MANAPTRLGGGIAMTVPEPKRESCDRADTIIKRSENCHWITVHDRQQLHANLRIALDTEVEAGGPYLNNGWNAARLLVGVMQTDARDAEIEALSGDIRWAINVLLEKIAAKFEANDTWDIWKSDAASLVRSFKHALPAQCREDVARALHEAHKPFCDYTYDFEDPQSSRHVYETLADAVLALLAEPSRGKT